MWSELIKWTSQSVGDMVRRKADSRYELYPHIKGKRQRDEEGFYSLLLSHKWIKSISLERVTTAMPIRDPYSVDFTFMAFGGQVTSQFRHSMHISCSMVISPFWGGKSNFSNCMGHSSMHREQPFWKCKHWPNWMIILAIHSPRQAILLKPISRFFHTHLPFQEFMGSHGSGTLT